MTFDVVYLICQSNFYPYLLWLQTETTKYWFIHDGCLWGSFVIQHFNTRGEYYQDNNEQNRLNRTRGGQVLKGNCIEFTTDSRGWGTQWILKCLLKI